MIGFNNKKIGFIIDSSSNIKDGTFDDVKVIPLGVTVQTPTSTTSYKDGVDFDDNDLAKVLSQKDTTVKTSQVAMQDMLQAAQEMCSKYDQVFVFPIHKNLSGNINSWKLLKDDFPNLNVVMTCDISYSFAWTIEEVKELLKKQEADEATIQKFVDEQIIPHRVGFMLVEDLEQLKKGGRVSGIKAAVAKLFKIMPLILFDHNGLSNYGKSRNYEGMFAALDDIIKKRYNNQKIEKILAYVPRYSEEAKTKYMIEFTKHYGNVEYRPTHLSTIVLCHTGIKYCGIYVKLK